MAAVSGKKPFWSASRHLDKLSILLFLAVWELLPKAGGMMGTFIAPPTVVVGALIELFTSGEMVGHVAISLYRAASGFAAASLIGIPLGFFLSGGFRSFERIITPIIRVLGQVNPFSLFPLFILLFGIGELSKGAMIFWVSLWPILFNTINGVKGVDPLLIKSARSMGIGIPRLFFKVILPASSPGIFHGLKMGSGTAFFMLIAAEMIGASRGLGWLVWNAQINFQMARLFAATVLISVLGLLVHFLFGTLETRLTGWKQKAIGEV